ncbi:MAG: TatD family hydrolase [Dissulfurispiraceae bacterium]|jgi:predicted TIM-barrel fold metal-dependent hydrolase|nr:TatD family hydrolase [Dissulfurispiraceae bacterium]
MRGIIDFHTHAFPDALAERAMKSLCESADMTTKLNGTLADLLRSMDANEIEKSVLCSIATKPSQFDPIIKWSVEIASDRIIPLPSVHPADADFDEHLRIIKAEGFKGIKMHPYYQEFAADEERMFRFYESLCREELILVMHTGYDISFPRIDLAGPVQIINAMTRFPEMKFVTTHFGSWQQWEDVREHLIGKPIYMELSFALEFIEKETASDMIRNHPKEYILFGTDSPWTEQDETLDKLMSLGLGPEYEQLILRDNALRLLDSVR